MSPTTALGYTEAELSRLHRCFASLNECFGEDGWYAVGGVSTRYRLEQAGHPLPKRPFNGADIVAIKPVPASIGRFFLIAHRHSDGYAALVHKATGVKVNIFPPRHINELDNVLLFPGCRVHLQTAADQLVSVTEDLQRLTVGQPIDPKQADDAARLMLITPPAERNAAWGRRHPGTGSSMFAAAYAEVLEARTEHPQLQRPGLFTSLPHRARQVLHCPDCVPPSRLFPYAPKSRIVKAYCLGPHR